MLPSQISQILPHDSHELQYFHDRSVRIHGQDGAMRPCKMVDALSMRGD